MDFAYSLKKEQIVTFLKKLFGSSFKAVYLDTSEDGETITHGKLKLSGVKGAVPFSFDNFHFRISFIKIDDIRYNKFGETPKQKSRYLNRKFRIFLYEIFGEDYYKALEEYLEKDSNIEQTILKQSINLVEKKYNFLTSEIKSKIAKLQKELKEAENKKENEIKTIINDGEQEIALNKEILDILKTNFSEKTKS